MVSNYRKSPGRFGEIDNELGIERPPVRPSIAFPNARNALHAPGSESVSPSMEKSDSTPTTTLCLSTTDADDLSSLGDDPSILEILFPASLIKVTSQEQVNETNSPTAVTRTMTTLMDLFQPTESSSTQQRQSDIDAINQVTLQSEPLSDALKEKKKKKKEKKKKKRSSEGCHDDKKTVDTMETKKSKDEQSKTKKKKSKENSTSGDTKKTKKKKKKSPTDPSSPHVTSSSKEPTKKEKKKKSKSDISPLELNVDKSQEKKQKKSSKGKAVIPSSTHQELDNERSIAKGKSACREKSSSHNDNSLDISPNKKDDNGRKGNKRKSASGDFRSESDAIRDETKNSASSPTFDSMLVAPDEKADDHSFDERSFFSCARSTFTYDCFDLPDSTKHHRDEPPKDIRWSRGTPNRALEFAIASVPKERSTERNPMVTKKSKGHFLKRFFGELHVTQDCQ
jgi:hypothetical protein